MERRLSTILAADIVGYSRLVGIDESGTVRAVKDLIGSLVEPKSAQYRGRIVKLMGDGVLMEFASVVDAVQFAVDMQASMPPRNKGTAEDRKLVFRIGINIGDIIVDGDDIQGDGVNIAARMEGIADHGGIALSDAAFKQVRGKLDLNFESMGAREVKNIAEPVMVTRVVMDDKAHSFKTEVQPLPLARDRGRKLPLVAVAVLLLAALVGGVAWWQFGRTPAPGALTGKMVLPLPKEPSVAVLPFKPLGGGETTDYFSNGVTNDLITDLSRFQNLFVSASNSVFGYKDKAVPVKEIGRELGVRYVLEGSAQQSGSRIRVNANLIEAETGKNIWSERFDRDLTDVFAVQDEIVQKILSALTLKVSEAELQRARAVRPENMRAYDYVLRGRNLSSQENRSSNIEGRRLFQTAIELEPDYALAYTELGRATLQAAANGWAQNPPQALKRVHDLAETALALKPHPQGHAVLGMAYLLMRHYDLARAELDKAIALNPNDAASYAALGGVNLWTSQPEAALKAYEKSLRLDPKSSSDVLMGVGAARFLMGENELALSALERAARGVPDDLLTQILLAATYGQLGRADEASKAAERVRKLHPFFSVAPYKAAFEKPEHGEHLADALAAVGLE